MGVGMGMDMDMGQGHGHGCPSVLQSMEPEHGAKAWDSSMKKAKAKAKAKAKVCCVHGSDKLRGHSDPLHCALCTLLCDSSIPCPASPYAYERGLAHA